MSAVVSSEDQPDPRRQPIKELIVRYVGFDGGMMMDAQVDEILDVADSADRAAGIRRVTEGQMKSVSAGEWWVPDMRGRGIAHRIAEVYDRKPAEDPRTWRAACDSFQNAPVAWSVPAGIEKLRDYRCERCAAAPEGAGA